MLFLVFSSQEGIQGGSLESLWPRGRKYHVFGKIRSIVLTPDRLGGALAIGYDAECLPIVIISFLNFWCTQH